MGYAMVVRRGAQGVEVLEVAGRGPAVLGEEALRRWSEAEQVAPPGPVPERRLSRLAALLEAAADDAADDALVQALVVLSRSGSPRALEAIRRVEDEGPKALRELATIAALECELWAAEPTPLPAPSPLRARYDAGERCPCGSGRRRFRCCDPG